MTHTRSLILAAALYALSGCSQQDSTLAPTGPELSQAAGTLTDPADKEANRADRGSAGLSSQVTSGSNSFSTAAASANIIPFDPEPGPFANRGPSCDDCVSTGLPIGFAFSFFGTSYTTFNLSSNGFIEFGAIISQGCCVGRSIPLADGIDNIIAAAWTDLYPGGGGLISYETRGRAPTRYLVVDFQDIPWCCEFGVPRVSTQIILYEGSNAIEIHTANQQTGHTYTQGIEDASGTQAAFIPGRVAANYGIVNDAVRFTTSSGSWTTRTALPSARRGLAAATASGLLYAIGGANSAGTALKTVQMYNPSTNSWTTKVSLPVARQSGNGATHISGTIYLPGGQDAAGVITRTLYAYKISTNTWSTKTNMPVFSGCGGSGVISGKLYVYSGCTRTATGSQTAAALLHRYDPVANSWTTLPGAPAVHVQPAVTVVGGKLYVAGGNAGGGAVTGRVDVYNPGTNSWATIPSMRTPRVASAGGLVGGKLYVVGGRNGSTYYNTVEVYDPLTNSWTSAAGMPTTRGALGVGVISGALYAIGGRNAATTALNANERLTP
jgi:N-acetylneuraminic acid mutarotase